MSAPSGNRQKHESRNPIQRALIANFLLSLHARTGA